MRTASKNPAPAPAPAARAQATNSRAAPAAANNSVAAKKRDLGLDAFGFGGGDEDFKFDENDLNFDDLENDRELMGELAGLGWTDHHEGEYSGMSAMHAPAARSKQSAPTSKSSASSSTLPTPNSGAMGDLLDFSSPMPNINLNVGELNEDDITLDEEDMNDPELLSQLRDIAGGDFAAADDFSGATNQGRSKPASTAAVGDLLSFEDEFDAEPAITAIQQRPQVSYGSSTGGISYGGVNTGAATTRNEASYATDYGQRTQAAAQARAHAAISESAAVMASATAGATGPLPSLAEQIATAKANALKMKKEGKREEALMWLRKAKMLESNGVAPPAPIMAGTAATTTRPVSTGSAQQQQQQLQQPKPAKPAPAGAASATGPKQGSVGTSQQNMVLAAASAATGRDAFSLLEDALKSAMQTALNVGIVRCN
jgi:hypothetical protein